MPWLGDVPEHWDVKRLKARVRNIIEQTKNRDDKDIYVALEHVESWTGCLRASGSDVTFDSQVKRFRADDVLFGKLRPYLAKVTRPTQDGVCVGEFLVLRPDGLGLHASYLEQLLRSKPIIDAINTSTFGAKMPRADWQFVGSLRVTLPTLPEQSAIARFLDHMDRRIGRAIRAKQKLIALLNEQKQAIIHQAVTRGLDPNVRLKPSGVAWLGDVPEHWGVLKLRQCVFILGGITPSMEVHRFWDGAIPWVTPKDMKRAAISDSTVRVTEAALQETSLRLIEPPAVLMVVRGMILARRVPIAWTTAPVTINQDMKALRPLEGIDAEFLARSLDSAQEAFKPLIDVAGHGTRRLPTERWRNLTLAMPPEDEQVTIIQFLDEATRTIVDAIERAQREISLLREYRTRLIADVVTGKLDVRAAAAGLPEETEESEPLDEVDALEDGGDEAAEADLDAALEEVTA